MTVNHHHNYRSTQNAYAQLCMHQLYPCTHAIVPSYGCQYFEATGVSGTSDISSDNFAYRDEVDFDVTVSWEGYKTL